MLKNYKKCGRVLLKDTTPMGNTPGWGGPVTRLLLTAPANHLSIDTIFFVIVATLTKSDHVYRFKHTE